MGWTKDQEKAIYESGQNIIVSAGAGSGKTAVLSERILEKVKSGVSIDSLLVLTFTEAAAFEMKERIKKKVKDISQDILDILENTTSISNMIKMLKQQGEQKINQLIKLAEKRKGAKNEDLQNVGHVMETSAKFIMTLLGNGFKAILNKLNRQQSMCYAIAKRASAEYHSAVLK